MDPQTFRSQKLRKLPRESGVYALCDLDAVPIYVGKSKRGKGEGIGPRVRRHLSSARSDVVANRQLDVWEIAYIWAWPIQDESNLGQLEAFLFHQFDVSSRLINGDVPAAVEKLSFELPQRIELQVIDDDEIQLRRHPAIRFPRQVQQFNQLLDWILNTKDQAHLRRALDVHFERVSRFYRQYIQARTPER